MAIAVLEALGDRVAERRDPDLRHRRERHRDRTGADRHLSAQHRRRRLARAAAPLLHQERRRLSGGKALRDMCVFARHDLTRDPPFSRLDLIVCRNVLIYLDAPLQKRVMSVFHYALKSRGFLMLGPRRPRGSGVVLHRGGQEVAPVPQVGGRRRACRSTYPSEPAAAALHAGAESTPRPGGREGKTLQDEATGSSSIATVPPGVIVDANYDIVQFRGHTGPYLEAAAGEPNLNILKMARGGLLHPLRTALQAARQRSRAGTQREHPGAAQRRLERRHARGRAGDDRHAATIPRALRRRQRAVEDSQRRAARSRARRQQGRRATPASSICGASWPRAASTCSRSSRSSRPPTKSCSRPTRRSSRATRSCRAPTRSSIRRRRSSRAANEELNTVNEELQSRNDELTRAQQRPRQPARQRRHPDRHRRQRPGDPALHAASRAALQPDSRRHRPARSVRSSPTSTLGISSS